MYRILLLAVAVSASIAVKADEADPGVWSGDVELGAVFTSGNTDQESVKFRFDSVREGEVWLNTFHADALTASQDGTETADKYYLFYRLDRKLDENSSLFTRLAYEDDQFSGFDSQIDWTNGYARTLLDNEKVNIVGDIGIGARYSEFEDGTDDTEFVGRVSSKLKWQVSENAQFSQFVGFEIGEERTVSRSETALKANIAGSLSMKLAVTIKNTSEVPAGREKTDTESTITLVYAF